jgi:hypothetical protein
LLAQKWFNETIATNHINNARKLVNPAEFNINPFLATYLANFLAGNSDAINIAKALVYPRVLGTSITTSFGTGVQKFTNDVLQAFGSTTAGIDIEFIDAKDGFRKYCQLKAGPNTINKDDVETIASHFGTVRRLAQTNNLRVTNDDLIVGILYGDEKDISSHYKRITTQYFHPVIVGKEFWHRLTGDETFYFDLIRSIGEVAIEADFADELDEIIQELASKPEIQSLANP